MKWETWKGEHFIMCWTVWDNLKWEKGRPTGRTLIEIFNPYGSTGIICYYSTDHDHVIT